MPAASVIDPIVCGEPSPQSIVATKSPGTEPGSLEVKVDKRSYPWRAVVKGARQVVGQAPESAQSFELELELVRTSRDELIEGLLVWGVRAKGDALDVGLLRP